MMKYIETPLSSEFIIRYKCSPGFRYASDHVYLEPSLDRKVVFIPDIRYSLKGGCESQICCGVEAWQGDVMQSHRFNFTELNIVEELMTDEMRRQMRDHGEIRLDFHFTEKGQTIAATDLPQLQFDDNGNSIAAKAVKETLAATGYMPTQPAGYSCPIREKIGGYLEEVKIVGKLGTFVFKYRTTGECFSKYQLQVTAQDA
ncbi:hypothetical protein P171DRAFT_446700 [Karstenula rhodostoma CBS 690.94]|uniref:DUF7918 domain-containing protein n=1 Tax=Karstenula rhodostoma CBS 690.94 TaxID=1392251 RepID=A0A9P4PEV7_9PLEO|nr:hypothetical protein P171DRAFT_446700 [Karstenula rhodostoma CBS 690.94]